jgi:hypothetical protein
MYRTLSMLAIGRMPERAMIRRIVKQFLTCSQFSNVRVSFEGSGRNSIEESKTCDLLLIGLQTAGIGGSRALALSKCPCVIWTDTWSQEHSRLFRRDFIRSRTRLLLVGKHPQRSPPLPEGVKTLKKSGAVPGEELFEYPAARNIMEILLETPYNPDVSGGHCPH